FYNSVLPSTSIEAHVRASGHAAGTPIATATAVSATSARVSWTPHLAVGSAPVTGYVIRAIDGGAVTQITAVDPWVTRTGATGLPLGNAARTVELWVNTGNIGYQVLAAYGSTATDQSFSVAMYGGDHVYIVGTNDDLDFGAPAAFADGSWHLLDVVYDGAGHLTVSIDAVSLGTQSFVNPLNTVADPAVGFILGNLDGSSLPHASIDEVAVYAGALTPARVQAHWDASGNIRGL